MTTDLTLPDAVPTICYELDCSLQLAILSSSLSILLAFTGYWAQSVFLEAIAHTLLSTP